MVSRNPVEYGVSKGLLVVAEVIVVGIMSALLVLQLKDTKSDYWIELIFLGFSVIGIYLQIRSRVIYGDGYVTIKKLFRSYCVDLEDSIEIRHKFSNINDMSLFKVVPREQLVFYRMPQEEVRATIDIRAYPAGVIEDLVCRIRKDYPCVAFVDFEGSSSWAGWQWDDYSKSPMRTRIKLVVIFIVIAFIFVIGASK